MAQVPWPGTSISFGPLLKTTCGIGVTAKLAGGGLKGTIACFGEKKSTTPPIGISYQLFQDLKAKKSSNGKKSFAEKLVAVFPYRAKTGMMEDGGGGRRNQALRFNIAPVSLDAPRWPAALHCGETGFFEFEKRFFEIA